MQKSELKLERQYLFVLIVNQLAKGDYCKITRTATLNITN